MLLDGRKVGGAYFDGDEDAYGRVLDKLLLVGVELFGFVFSCEDGARC